MFDSLGNTYLLFMNPSLSLLRLMLSSGTSSHGIGLGPIKVSDIYRESCQPPVSVQLLNTYINWSVLQSTF